MKEINLTINMMQTVLSEGTDSEMRYRLACLLEILRNEIQKCLVDISDGQPSENNQEPDRSIEAPEMQYVRESYDPPFEKDLDEKPAYWSVEKEFGYCFLW